MSTLSHPSVTTHHPCKVIPAAVTSSCSCDTAAATPNTAAGLQERLEAVEQQAPCNPITAAGTTAQARREATAAPVRGASNSKSAGCVTHVLATSGSAAAAAAWRVLASSASLRQQADSADQPPEAAAAVERRFSNGPVCAKCGSKGHLDADCRVYLCSSCKLHGHRPGTCKLACSRCGRLHAQLGPCQEPQCYLCKLFGHKAPECPSMQCVRCGLFRHMHR
jgi:hypothetical protein